MSDDPEPAAWIVRSGGYGERDAWALQQGLAGGGWEGIPDLSGCSTREDIVAVVEAASGVENRGTVNNWAAQLNALRFRILPGDLIVLPLKVGQIAVGTATDGYVYRRDEPDQRHRHVIPVRWLTAELPRTAVRQDLLFTLGGASTVFRASRHDAAWRLGQLARTGRDPGPRSTPDRAWGSAFRQGQPGEELVGPVDEPERVDLVRAARDRIVQRVQRNFTGHGLTELVAAVLQADGFITTVSPPPGPDGGADIIAGRGLLGLDAPRIVVQVKSEASPVGTPIVNQLQGVMASYGADQALLVAWGGVTLHARRALDSHQFRLKLWTAEDVIDAVLAGYPRLPGAVRAALPLNQTWVVVEDQAEDA